MIKQCVICGKEYKSPPSAKVKTCSPECSTIMRSKAPRLCQHCGKPIKSTAINTVKYCSRECAGLARQNYKTCVICGKQFPCPPSTAMRTCSPDCSTALRSRKSKTEENRAHITQAMAEYNKTLTPETHQGSKFWKIQAPDGQIYTCQNLLHFFRANPNLIDGTPEQAASGLVVVKSTLTGKRTRNKVYH